MGTDENVAGASPTFPGINKTTKAIHYKLPKARQKPRMCMCIIIYLGVVKIAFSRGFLREKRELLTAIVEVEVVAEKL